MDLNISLSDTDRSRPAVLCLSTLQFNRDIKALQKRSTRYAWPFVPDVPLINAQRSWMPARLQQQAYYVNESGPDVDAAWARAKALGLEILDSVLSQGVNLTAVMSGNWDYWHEEGMRLACQEIGLPFLVLMREHDLRGNQRLLADEFYGPLKRIPDVTAVAGAGTQTQALLTATGLFPPAKLRITGWPRLDIWRAPVPPAYDRPFVLMSYLKGYDADEHFIEMMHIFSDLAHQYPDIPFVVKAKHFGDLQVLDQVTRKRGLKPHVIDTTNLPSLLCNARAVIGFHSAAMYEALLAPARILIPRWGQTDQDPHTLAPSPTDERLHGHMEFLPTEEGLRRTVAECAASAPYPADMTARTKIFGEYFAYAPDRTAVERVEEFVDEFGKK